MNQVKIKYPMDQATHLEDFPIKSKPSILLNYQNWFKSFFTFMELSDHNSSFVELSHG